MSDTFTDELRRALATRAADIPDRPAPPLDVATVTPLPIRQARRLWPAALGSAAAVAAVVIALVTGQVGRSADPPVRDQALITEAAAAVQGPENSILHVVTTVTQTDLGGNVIGSWKEETWQHNAPPYDMRQASSRGGRELAHAGGAFQVYNPVDNTIHTTGPGVVSGQEHEFATGERIRDTLLEMLETGDARQEDIGAVDGHRAVRLVATDSSPDAGNYVVIDADTHEPIELRLRGEGPDGFITIRFDTFEWLPATKENQALLSLKARHPDAAVAQDVTVEGQ